MDEQIIRAEINSKLSNTDNDTLNNLWNSLNIRVQKKLRKLYTNKPLRTFIENSDVYILTDNNVILYKDLSAENVTDNFCSNVVEYLNNEGGTAKLSLLWPSIKGRPKNIRCKDWFLEYKDLFIIDGHNVSLLQKEDVQSINNKFKFEETRVEDRSVSTEKYKIKGIRTVTPKEEIITTGVMTYHLEADDAEVEKALEILPIQIVNAIEGQGILIDELSDIIIDVGKPIIVLTLSRKRFVVWEYRASQEDIDFIVSGVTISLIGNRCTIGNTLHRCSLIVEPDKSIIGLTIRISRDITGLADTIKDILLSGKSLLLMGRPGVGKTTLLRDIAYLHSNENEKLIMIVDTTCEIAGDGKFPHEAVGLSRRMKVVKRSEQHKVMMEAVQNHNPDTIIVDEIGMVQDALAAKSISERGVQLIGTTHGKCLTDLIRSPELKHLLGGFNTAILSENEKKSLGAISKTIIERKENPAFQICIELVSTKEWRIHYDIAQSVDAELNYGSSRVELRKFENGQLERKWIKFPYDEEYKL